MDNNQKSNLEPLCDPGRPSGLISLTVWSLAFLVIWGLLVVGVWHFLSSHYQNQEPKANSQPAVAIVENHRR